MLPNIPKFVHIAWGAACVVLTSVLLLSFWQGGDWAAAGRAVGAATGSGDAVVVTPAHYYREVRFFRDRVVVASNTFPQELMGRSSHVCVVSHGPPPVEWRNALASKQVVLDEEFGALSTLCVADTKGANP